MAGRPGGRGRGPNPFGDPTGFDSHPFFSGSWKDLQHQ